MALLLTLWSFLTSRVGILIIACLLSFGSGYSLKNRQAEIDRLNAEVQTAKSDQATAKNSEDLAKRQTADLNKHQEDNERRIQELEASLAKEKNKKPDTRVVTKTVKAPAPAGCDRGLTEEQLRRFKEIR